MNIVFDKSFNKSLGKIKNKIILNGIEKAIIATENAKTTKNIPNFKKLTGHKNFYRIKMGDYRIGIEKEGEILRFVIVLHRKDIYKKFP